MAAPCVILRCPASWSKLSDSNAFKMSTTFVADKAGVWDSDLKELARTLKENSNLTTLSLKHNNITAKGTATLCEALREVRVTIRLRRPAVGIRPSRPVVSSHNPSLT